MRFGTIAMIYTLFLDIIVFTTFAMRQNELVYEFNQRQQDIQVNYATDAAAWMMLYETPDIDIDYNNINDIRVSPEVALNTYEAIMIRGMGWSDDTYNRQVFEDTYMPFFIVAAYDGYYIYTVVSEDYDMSFPSGTTVTNTIYPKRWTPKIPYAEFSGDGSKIILYNLGGKYYTTYTYATNEYKYDNVYSDMGGPATNKSSEDMKQLVSAIMTDTCQKALVIAKGEVTEEQIVIPADFSEWSSNRPVEYPTVLTYMDASSTHIMYDHVSFAVGGSRIQETTYYIGYTKDGVKRYTLATNRSYIENTDHLTVEKVFTSQREAALDGYYYDLRFLSD